MIEFSGAQQYWHTTDHTHFVAATIYGGTRTKKIEVTTMHAAMGMAIRYQFPDTARRLEKQMSRLAVGLLALIIVLLLIREGSKLPEFLVQVGIGVVLLNLLATPAGFLVGKLFRLPLAHQILCCH